MTYQPDMPGRTHHSDHGLPGHPCHELYARCFRTDAELLEYRVRQREHGARKEREQRDKWITDTFRELDDGEDWREPIREHIESHGIWRVHAAKLQARINLALEVIDAKAQITERTHVEREVANILRGES